MFTRFDMIHERDRQTDGQTDRHRMTAYRPRFCIASRGKNQSLPKRLNSSLLLKLLTICCTTLLFILFTNVTKEMHNMFL